MAAAGTSRLVRAGARRHLRFDRTALRLEPGADRHGQHLLCRRGKERDGELEGFFFGSLDPGSFITVDKPPAALWVMELSGRIFGFSSWSMLLPEALAGVATVMVLYHLVRRWFGEPAAVFASLALALTPVAVVIFRYNDPDAFLTLLLVLAAWACWRAIETGKTIGLVLVRRARRPRLSHQDARRLHRRPGPRRSPTCGAARPAWPGASDSSAGPPLPCSSRAGGGWPSSNCGRRARALHRRQHRQLRAQSDLRLQRVRADLRLGRCRAGGGSTGRLIGLRRRRGPAADVRQRARWPDLVAPPARRRRPRRRPVADPPPPARRRPACRVRAVGRHAPDVPGGLRLRPGDLPPLLHGRDGTGGGRARRRRRRRPLASRAPVASLGLGAARPPSSARSLWADTLLARTSAATTPGSGRRSW